MKYHGHLTADSAFRMRVGALCLWGLLTAVNLLSCGGANNSSTLVLGADPKGVADRILPKGWAPVSVRGPGTWGWSNTQNYAVIELTYRCGARWDIPHTALTRQLLIGFHGPDLLEQEFVPYAGREALRTHLTASLDGVQRELETVVLKKDGCAYSFVLAAPPGETFESARSDFQSFVDGFETTHERRTANSENNG